MPRAAFERSSAFWDGRIERAATFNEVGEEGTANACLREMARKSEELKLAMRELCGPKSVATQPERHRFISVA
jgi:hypothetical protein